MQTIILKHSATPGAQIPELAVGEMAINTSDDILYIHNGAQLTPLKLKTINGETLFGVGDITTISKTMLDGYADVGHTHDLNQIILTGDKRFLSDDELSSAISITNTMADNDDTITEFETDGIPNLTDNKTRLDVNGNDEYLEAFLDDAFTLGGNGKLSIVKLSGVNVSVTELNMLSGVKGNLQEAINNLKSIGKFMGAVESYSLLDTIVASEGDIYIVIKDETNLNATSIYEYKNSVWVARNTFRGYVRDFTKNPIDLRTEVKGEISRNMFPAQTALETEIRNTGNFNSTNVEDALIELNNGLN